jgi:hypothetical protein
MMNDTLIASRTDAPDPTPRTCVECSKMFALDEAQQAFYALHGWVLPRRCAHCRRARREARVGEHG